MIKKCGLAIAGCLFSLQALAADKTYTIFSLGFTDLEYSEQETNGLGYKLGIGYQFHPQWYVEAGYQQIVDESLFVDTVPSPSAVLEQETKLQGDALFLAFLGKASGRQGELFYRLGVLKTDMRGQTLKAGEASCDLGQAHLIQTSDLQPATICDFDESGSAAVLGLGYDYFIGARTMLRAEVEYIKGSQNLTATTLSVGIRYNF